MERGRSDPRRGGAAHAVGGVLRSAVKTVGMRLMDAVEPNLSQEAAQALAETDGVDEVADVRIRWVGHALTAEATIGVDETLTVREAHATSHHAAARMREHLPRLGRASVHVRPVQSPACADLSNVTYTRETVYE